MEAVSKTKNLGIESLRIVCILMIIVMHLLYKGNVLYSENLPSFIVNQAWFLEALCYVAVNCFVMISGWLLVDKENLKIARVKQLWLRTIAYSIIIGTICFFLFSQTKKMLLVKSWLPVLSNSYWFITSYLLLYLLAPFINKLIHTLDQKEFKKLLIILLAAFCIWQNVLPFFETLDTSHGYSMGWFIILYLTGAYLKKYGLKKMRGSIALGGYALCSVGVFSSRRICLLLVDKFGFFAYYTDSSYTYNSILVFIASVCLFLFFAKGEGWFQNKPVIAACILFFSEVTLDVYLIHEQVVLREYLWTDIIPVERWSNSPFFLLIVFGITITVFVICSLLGKIRTVFFHRGRKKE